MNTGMNFVINHFNTLTNASDKDISFLDLKLYCGYKYTRHCMINRVWGLKTTKTTGEW